MQKDNPLLTYTDLPPYSHIDAEQVVPAIDNILASNRQAIDSLLKNPPSPLTWENTALVLDEINEKLSKTWSPVSHLNAVMNNEALRVAYEACLPKLSSYSTEMGQNKPLYELYQALNNSPAANNFNTSQQSILKHILRDFHLSGIDLPPAEQQRYGEIQAQLAELSNKFSNKLLDATQAWTKHITHEQALKGIPESAKQQMAQSAKAKNLTGWLITLEYPCYSAVITYADDRALREEIYQAYCTRASDQGPIANKFDNGPIMQQILALRHELAILLGFNNYAELSLADKMAETPEQVLNFLNDLAERSKPFAEQDLKELSSFVAEQGITTLQNWDVSYYSEKLREARYSISDEALRVYFPINKVLAGLFNLVNQLYGIEIHELKDFDTWHPDVRLFAIQEQGKIIGRFFFDLYARPNKRGGAWMDGARDRYQNSQGEIITPVANIVCNFMPASHGQPALLTHDEVTTLFHEFGHGLHHMLTQVNQLGASGINGVAWDAVELPSQFMENWCWQTQSLALISSHYQTGEPLPKELLEKMLAAKNFQSALMMVRQLEFSLFDFELHTHFGDGRTIEQVLASVREKVAVLKPPSYNRFANSFAHIFAGGYAAGYYSYKWAELLSADAFSRFEEEGILNSQTGRLFRDTILAKGGSQEPLALFIEFRGREPNIEALLRHSGLS